MESRALLLSIVFWSIHVVSCGAMEGTAQQEELKLETTSATITYENIKDSCPSMTNIVIGKNKYIYNSFFKGKKIPLRDLTHFCNQAIDRLKNEVLSNHDLLDCFDNLKKACEQKHAETLEKMTNKGSPLGKRGSMIIPRKDAPIKGMTYYKSRNKDLKNTLDLKTILNLPKNAPTGKDITIGLYEEGIEFDHYTVSECVKKSHTRECLINYLDKEHGTSVGSVLATIAPGAAINLITSPDSKELESPDALITKMFPKIHDTCKEETLIDCLDEEETKSLLNEIKNLVHKTIKDSKVINVSRSFSLGEEKDAQFSNMGSGMPFVFSLLTTEYKILIVKAAGNYQKPIFEDLRNFVNHDAAHRMIIVGSLAYTEKGENFADDHSSFAVDDKDIFICAPGKDILVGIAKLDQGHDVQKGTSLATPIVAAFLADLMEKYPQWQEEPEKYISILLDSARRETLDGKDEQERKQNYQTRIGTKCGHGILDIPAALKLAEVRAS